MAQRGRKSAASLQIATTLAACVTATQRLPPPAGISEAERGVWLELINDQPAEAFSATHAPLLEMYCRHVVRAGVIADELSKIAQGWANNEDELKRFNRLLAMAERESRAASSLATRLRLTRQAVENPMTVGRGLAAAARNKKPKPWESDSLVQ